MKKILILFFFPLAIKAQDSLKPLRISAYIETYYCYDFGEPTDHVRPSFFYNYNRHNEFNLNLGYIKAAYQTNRVRANLALMAGTYSEYNLATEGALKNIFEANAGIRLGKKNAWIDAGIFPSHLGFESAVGMESWNLTRSILAENSPYYETGMRLSGTSKNSKWYGAFLLLNGWQKIKRPPGNQTPAFGTQLTFDPSKKISINWSTFVGNDYPDSVSKWRVFNNFYARMQLTEKLGITAGFDIGFEQLAKHSTFYGHWLAPVIIMRYEVSKKWFLAGRIEYYDDEKNIIVQSIKSPFEVLGYSLNLDFLPFKNVVCRAEARLLNSSFKILQLEGKSSALNYFTTLSLAIKIE